MSTDSVPAFRPVHLLLGALLLLSAAAAAVTLLASDETSGGASAGAGADPFRPSSVGDAAEPDLVLYVSGDGGGDDDGNNCSDAKKPCRGLARAIKLATARGADQQKQIILGAGRLEIDCNVLSGVRDLRITGQGPQRTSLVGPFPGDKDRRPCALFMISGKNITLEGFSLLGIADHMGDGIGVRVNGPAVGVLLRDLRFDGRVSAAGQRPGAMGLQLNGAPGKEARDVTVLRSQFLGFKSKAGILVKGPSVAVRIYNSVFHDNDRGIGISSDRASRSNLRVTVENCIFHKNEMGISAAAAPSGGDVYRLDYNLFFRGGSERVPRGEHSMFEENPHFVDPPRDFSLQTTAGGHHRCSPAIDRGDPAHDHSREPSPAGGRINLGIRGNTTSAARSCSD